MTVLHLLTSHVNFEITDAMPLDLVQKSVASDPPEISGAWESLSSYPAREELGLLAKCANPPCAALFRFLQEGTLFRFQSETLQRIPSLKETEYFWLCPNCAKKMIVRLDATSKIRLVRQPDGHSPRAGSTSFTLMYGMRRLRLSYPWQVKTSVKTH